MFIQKTLAAGVVALTALATTAPAQAESFSFGIYGDHGGVTFHSGDGYRPAGHWNDRRWNDRRWDYAHYRMTPRQVRRSLRHRGFDRIRFTDTQGRIYRARATNRRGRRVALTIRSRDARIVEMHRIRRHY
jgi:hypothetical protein